jgi:DNA processing protein
VDAAEQRTALVALRRAGRRAFSAYAVALRDAADPRAVDARAVLEQQLGLLSYDAYDRAQTEIAGWQERGYEVLAFGDEEYPSNLRRVAGCPLLLFVVGRLDAADVRAVSIIGTRTPSAAGRRCAGELAEALGAAGYTVVSGLAAGIDTAAHGAALAARRRTVAVIGTGLDHCYPRENCDLQRQIAAAGAVISQFWPEAEASRRSFPLRNVVMSGLTQASIIVEAGEYSGTRIQARAALAQGRGLILMTPVLVHEWARELRDRPGVGVAERPGDVIELLRR